ncbi:coiled-coil domain-containing protein 50 isoform X1 [Protopterus annectens]|uniref:coiled-coil domain-containing protein 50 isoform X1 n=1 Tax=Protopterus annectens TaxID=7888 RepID=UPI001CFB0B9D|nr:coiled-coil domain-containing protein 50 isoform X1 [Protopterus annectens]
MDDRADFYVDQSKLPGVREVCRDFAVLEDHTLAHNLQEQEIEHHLATNVHRHRLVQHDLKVAKKLQEEEDVKAWTERQKKKKKDLERHDNEVAHVFQEELVIQAQQRRWQEEKDESVARKLQQKELKEEKRRNKHKDITGHVPYEDSCSDPYGDILRGGHPQHTSDNACERSRHNRSQELSSKSKSKHTVSHSQFFVDNCDKIVEHSKRTPHETASYYEEEREMQRHKRGDEHEKSKRERPPRPPPPDFSKDFGKSAGQRNKENSEDNWANLDRPRSRSCDDYDRTSSHKGMLSHMGNEGVNTWDYRQTDMSDPVKDESRPAASWKNTEGDRHLHSHNREIGVKQRGLRDVSHGVAQLSVRDQKLKDADIARRLQEEELMMNKIVRFDSKTAQMAQDEEIARFLMEEENREFRKDKDKNKMSFEKRRQDKKHEQSNLVHACAKESYESSSSRTEPSSRSPVLGQQFESPVRLSPVYSSPRRAIPRPEYVHKGS